MPNDIDKDEAVKAKLDAMDRVMKNANPDWVDAFYRSAGQLIPNQPVLTSNDVIDNMPKNIQTPNHKVAGPLMSRLAKAGLIKKLGYRASARPRNHDRPIQEWESLVYKDLL